MAQQPRSSALVLLLAAALPTEPQSGMAQAFAHLCTGRDAAATQLASEKATCMQSQVRCICCQVKVNGCGCCDCWLLQLVEQDFAALLVSWW
jgi:hypothetical protein